jgi:excisionase family DNA binding protein
MSSERIISIAAAARATGLPYHTLRRLIHLRRVASVRVGGTRRVRLSAVRVAIEEATTVA